MTRMRRRLLGAIVLAAVVGSVAGLLHAPAHAQEKTKVSLRLKWLPQAQFIGYYVAQAKGYYAAENLDVTINPGGPNIIAENLVASGSEDFGHGGGFETLLTGRDKGLPIVGIGVLFQKTPFAFVAKKEAGIAKFEDLRGKKVSTWYTGAQFILRAMLLSRGIGLNEVTEVPQGVSMTPFINGDVNVATVTFYSELQTLYQQGLKDLVLFDPADFGIVIPREIIITSEKTLKERPAVVQRFLRATLKGWKDALANQPEALEILMRLHPNLNRAHQEVMLREVAKLVLWGPGRNRGIGAIDRGALEYANRFLLENKQLTKPVNLDQAVDLRFWEQVPATDKKL